LLFCVYYSSDPCCFVFIIRLTLVVLCLLFVWRLLFCMCYENMVEWSCLLLLSFKLIENNLFNHCAFNLNPQSPYSRQNFQILPMIYLPYYIFVSTSDK
jgi:hypothetical protein